MQSRRIYAGFGCTAWLAFAALAFMWPGVSKAGSINPSLTFTAPTFTAAAPSTGSFDVTLTNNTGAAANIASFGIELSVPTLSGVTFTAVTDTGANYIFAPQPGSFAQTYPPGVTDVSVGDAYLNLSPDEVTVGNGATVGLVQISYSISNTAVGTIPLAFTFIPSDSTSPTILSDDMGNPIYPTNVVNGSITISSSMGSAVPLPTSATAGMALLACVAAASLLARRPRDGAI